ncbi:hypothetical protein GCM10025771_25390 [Niveibacterium umoris]
MYLVANRSQIAHSTFGKAHPVIAKPNQGEMSAITPVPYPPRMLEKLPLRGPPPWIQVSARPALSGHEIRIALDRIAHHAYRLFKPLLPGHLRKRLGGTDKVIRHGQQFAQPIDLCFPIGIIGGVVELVVAVIDNDANTLLL